MLPFLKIFQMPIVSQGQEISCQSAFQECLELTLQHDMHPKVQEYAFKSLGQIGTARPNLLMRTQSRTLISRALKDARNFALKRAALSILLDLLNADASSLNQAQKNKEKGKKKQTKKGGKGSAHVPCQNGESDDLFAGSSLLQVFADLLHCYFSSSKGAVQSQY